MNKLQCGFIIKISLLSLFSLSAIAQDAPVNEKGKKNDVTYTQEQLDAEVKKQVSEKLEKKIKYLKNTSLTQFTTELLEKEKKLEQWESQLKEKEEALNQGESSLAKEIAELNQERQKILGCISKNQQEEAQRINRIVEVIMGMKPNKAADLLTVQEPDVTVQILERLDTTRASKIFNAMDKEVSAQLQKQYLDMQK